MSPKAPRTFHFHACAHAFSANFTRPFHHQIDIQAQSALPVIGGHGHSRVDSFEFRSFISFKNGYSHVSGGHQADDDTHNTLATAVLEGLNMFDVLTVDRVVFATRVQERVLGHPNITLVRGEVTELPSPGIIATGPLTSDALAAAIARRLGAPSLAFYDAIAPIVSADSLDYGRLFKASRYGKGGGDDYWNAPFTQGQYEAFVAALIAGDQYAPGVGHEFDKVSYFEGCLPVEEMAQRGLETLRFGPMKPIGLVDPKTGREPYAVVQLRQEDRAAQMWNLVGFQTRLKTGGQQKIFRTIPGLEAAEFLRFGSIHRNSYLNAPAALTPHLSAKDDPQLLFA